jgi:hypothetical protein
MDAYGNLRTLAELAGVEILWTQRDIYNNHPAAVMGIDGVPMWYLQDFDSGRGMFFIKGQEMEVEGAESWELHTYPLTFWEELPWVDVIWNDMIRV